MWSRVVVIAAVAWARTTIAIADTQCAVASAQLSVNLSTNASGHWTTTLHLSREWPVSGRPGVLQLQVQPTTGRCRGVRSDALSVTLRGPPAPEPGYVQLQDFGSYKVHVENVTWEEAKAACEEEGAHLLVLNSLEEADAVLRLVRLKGLNPKAQNIFAGFHDKDQEGRHVTIFGEPLESTGFLRWYTGEPSNTNGVENCGAVIVEPLALNDVPCTTLKCPFICEQNVV